MRNIENTHSKWAAINRMSPVAKTEAREDSRIKGGITKGLSGN